MEGKEHRLRELELLEVIANQGLEIAHLKGQVSRVQLEKILTERKQLQDEQKVSPMPQPKKVIHGHVAVEDSKVAGTD